jgi:flagellar assembly factor FliW
MGDFLDDIVYSENDIIKFQNGIPGFNDNKEFVIIQTPEFAPFEWLVCIDTATKLRFAVINPMLFRPDYSPNIEKEQIEDLEIEKPEDILLYAIVTIKKDPAESTANLLGPVIINKTKRIGKQVIIEDTNYTTKEKII